MSKYSFTDYIMTLIKRHVLAVAILQILAAACIQFQGSVVLHASGPLSAVLSRIQANSPVFHQDRYSILIGISSNECQGCAIPALNALIDQAQRLSPEPNMFLVVDSAAAIGFESAREKIHSRNTLIDTNGDLFDALDIKNPPELIVIDPKGNIAARIPDIQHVPIMLKDIFDTLTPGSSSIWDNITRTSLSLESSRSIGRPYSTAFDAVHGRTYLLDPRSGLVSVVDAVSGSITGRISPDDKLKYLFRHSANEPQWKVLEQIGAELAHIAAITLSPDGDTLFALVSVNGRYIEDAPVIRHNGKDTLYPVRWEKRQVIAGYVGDSVVTIRPVPDSTIILMNLVAMRGQALLGSCMPDIPAGTPRSLLTVGAAGMVFRASGKGGPGVVLHAYDLRNAYPTVVVDSRSAGMLCSAGMDRVCYLDPYAGLFFLLDISTGLVTPIPPQGALVTAFGCGARLKTSGNPSMDCGILPTSVASNGSHIYVILTVGQNAHQTPVLQIYNMDGRLLEEHDVAISDNAANFASIVAAEADRLHLLVQWKNGMFDLIQLPQ